MEAQVKGSAKFVLAFVECHETAVWPYISEDIQELIRNKVIGFRLSINSNFHMEVETWIEKEELFNEFVLNSDFAIYNNAKEIVLNKIAHEIACALLEGIQDDVILEGLV